MSFLRPLLSQAYAPPTREIEVVDAHGMPRSLSIPAERALTVYLDKRELVTLMTLGAYPELLALGYLRNQRLVGSIEDIESVTVDWDVDAVAVRTRSGRPAEPRPERSRVVTTGCGQGSMFADLMDEIDGLALAPAQLRQADLYAVVDTIRQRQSVYKTAGSVHGCALFQGGQLLSFVEDVGRHNAVDTIAGWMWMQAPEIQRGGDKVFYTTGRLTSEMVIKAAQMGIPIVVSRSGMTEMGLRIARQIGLCAIGRATNRSFLCFSAPERLLWEPELAGPRLRAVA